MLNPGPAPITPMRVGAELVEDEVVLLMGSQASPLEPLLP